MKATILIVDNDAEFLETAKQLLEGEGFRVFPASTAAEATGLLESHSVDVAVLDLRLTRDNDASDASGLQLAKSMSTTIPKIIMTRYPTVEEVREALRPQLGSLPLAFSFVVKQEGIEVLAKEVRRCLWRSTDFLRSSLSKLVRDSEEKYEDTARRTKRLYRVAVGGSVASFIFTAVVAIPLFIRRSVTEALIAILVGAILQAACVLYLRSSKDSAVQSDRSYAELLRLRGLQLTMEFLSQVDGQQSANNIEQSLRELRTLLREFVQADPTAQDCLGAVPSREVPGFAKFGE